MSVTKKRHLETVQHKMMFYFIISLIVMLLAFSVIVFILARIRTESNSMTIMNNSAAVISGIVKDYMAPKIEAVRNSASDESIVKLIKKGAESEKSVKNTPEYEYAANKLSEMSVYNPDIVSSWIVFENDRVLISDNGVYLGTEELQLDSLYCYNDISIRGMNDYT